MRPLLTLAFLASAGLATADEPPKPIKLTAEVLDEPSSASERQRWRKQLEKDLQGKPVEVYGEFYHVKGKVYGQVVVDHTASILHVFIKIKGDFPEKLVNGGVKVTGKGRVESYPSEVWIDEPTLTASAPPSKMDKIRKRFPPPDPR